jgi:hypothetical protein
MFKNKVDQSIVWDGKGKYIVLLSKSALQELKRGTWGY